LYEPRYGAYVLRREGLLGWADLGEAAPIDATVTALRTSMADPLRRSSVAELAAKLYTQVIAPVETHLEGASHWIVAPDGQLSLAPFHALRDHDGRSVLERVAVSCVATGRHLARPPLAGRDAGPPVIVAAPDFDARRGMKIASASAAPTRSADLRWAHFGALPETAREAEAIAVKLPDAEIFLAAEADETRVKAVVRPRILHIATHGYFLESEADGAGVAAIDDPLLRSGLVLAGANHLDGAARGAEDDGVLTALEASSLDLAATELVVLSACETGLGAVGAGDGVFGLQRAFSMAGARSQVLSLWRVDDTATRKLMVGFYERLAGGASRLEALRQSQLALLADPATAHPFFWGAFQLYGDWGPLTPAP
jgi:CHAT domain-containing protein